MSKEELARFREALLRDTDGSLRRKIGHTYDGRKVTKVANELGFDFTYQEWKEAPKLHPIIVWIFVIAMIAIPNWGLVESYFEAIHKGFRGDSVEQLRRP